MKPYMVPLWIRSLSGMGSRFVFCSEAIPVENTKMNFCTNLTEDCNKQSISQHSQWETFIKELLEDI